MLTFLEFYQTHLGFVNFKLYTDVNLVYPPKVDSSKDEGAAGLGALIIETTNNLVGLSSTSQDSEIKEESNNTVSFIYVIIVYKKNADRVFIYRIVRLNPKND